MPAISLGFGEVEERLQQIRRRLNSLSLQHIAYLSGTLIALLGALLVVVFLRAPPHLLRPYATGYALIVCAIGVVAAFRLRAAWLSLDSVARLADREATLDSRVSTLWAHRSGTRRSSSRLKGLLLAQTLALTPRWDRSALAPRRVPRSIYLLLGSLALLVGTSWLVPPRPAAPTIAANSTSASAAENENAALDGQTMEAETAPGSRQGGPGSHADGVGGKGTKGRGAGSSTNVTSTGGRQRTDLGKLDDSLEPGASGRPGASGGRPREVTAKADTGQRMQSLPADGGRKLGRRQAQLRRENQGDPSRDGPNRHPSARKSSGLGENATQRRQDAARNPGMEQPKVDGKPRSQAQTESAKARGGAKASGKIGSLMNDALYESGTPHAQGRRGGKPGTFALRLTGQAVSQPTDFEPQHQRREGGMRGLGAEAEMPGPEMAEQQIEDDPLQKAQISPEHESLLRRIFQRD